MSNNGPHVGGRWKSWILILFSRCAKVVAGECPRYNRSVPLARSWRSAVDTSPASIDKSSSHWGCDLGQRPCIRRLRWQTEDPHVHAKHDSTYHWSSCHQNRSWLKACEITKSKKRIIPILATTAQCRPLWFLLALKQSRRFKAGTLWRSSCSMIF